MVGGEGWWVVRGGGVVCGVVVSWGVVGGGW